LKNNVEIIYQDIVGAGDPPIVHSIRTGSPAVTSIFSLSGVIKKGATQIVIFLLNYYFI
jgi:hypothetical protein